MLDTSTFSRYSKSKMPLNLHIKRDEITTPFLLILTRAGEKHPPVPTFHCAMLPDGNASDSITLWWEEVPGEGLSAQEGGVSGRGVMRDMGTQSFPETPLVRKPTRGFPSPGCRPGNQIILAGALIWWMLHCLYKLSSSSRREPKKRKKAACMSRKRTGTWAGLLHWDEYLHVYF